MGIVMVAASISAKKVVILLNLEVFKSAANRSEIRAYRTEREHPAAKSAAEPRRLIGDHCRCRAGHQSGHDAQQDAERDERPDAGDREIEEN